MSSFEIKEFESHHSIRVQDLLKGVFEKCGFGFDLTGKDKDLLDIHGNYFVAHGKFWLLTANKEVIGTVALKPFQNDCYELKRFFIQETNRGKGYGNRALEFVINYLKEKKIKSIRLDTNNKLESAIHLYEKFGFHEIEPYRNSNVKELKWFELLL